MLRTTDVRTRAMPDGQAQSHLCGCPPQESRPSGVAGISRRAFLQRAAAAGVLGALFAEGLSTRLAFAATPYGGDVLVVLSLRGGFDGLQAVVPAADPDYPTWRPNVGIPTGALLPLDATFGLHPGLAALKPLFDAGDLGFVTAVGMEEPNRSHFQAMEEMERAAPGSSLRTGWLDRVLGLRSHDSEFQAIQMGSSLAPTSLIGPSPELAMWSLESFGLDAAWDDAELTRWDTALRAMHTGAPAVLEAPALGALGALETATVLTSTPYTPGATYPDSDLGRALADVARLIKAGVGLQAACVDYGDWDMHAGMGTVDEGWMHDHLLELGTALAAFAQDLGPSFTDVTLVTLTEFGRRVEENGSGGTDHGYGQTVFLLGGGVKGGQVHGVWPGLAPADLIDGDLAKTTDYRAILAEILEKRCEATSVADVFPGLPSDRPGVVNQRPS